MNGRQVRSFGTPNALTMLVSLATVILAACTALVPAGQSAPPGRTELDTAAVAIPPIDAAQPTQTETATFALG